MGSTGNSGTASPAARVASVVSGIDVGLGDAEGLGQSVGATVGLGPSDGLAQPDGSFVGLGLPVGLGSSDGLTVPEGVGVSLGLGALLGDGVADWVGTAVGWLDGVCVASGPGSNVVPPEYVGSAGNDVGCSNGAGATATPSSRARTDTVVSSSASRYALRTPSTLRV
jgi:hypothetical protein